ncbi:xanthine dehydrogenase family protein molybdopterin-binding subunit [Sphingomonas colocasiae]|uniref:Molybdopterin-dependent oxidoreductase n=1 Tax=Sphingomonas colocasiae TaxID=1848973 RepID=A0ABS7PN26_9SPHN|nr:molybdopterin cofactor-binding domain-containing protein [Sphingomonas colocasiae]MBY8822712.1 molybdopterin-dependent oxidoreductase [Sphingomonas colocasiae]
MTIQLDRRAFLRVTAVSGAMVLTMPRGAIAAIDGAAADIGLHIRLTPDNRLTIRTATTEIGQGTNTSIPMLIVEELDFPFDRTSVQNMVPPIRRTAEGRIESQVFAGGAGGSTAIAASYDAARQTGAIARNLLMQEAAARWSVPIGELTTADGFVVHVASKRRLAYGALAGGAAGRPVPTGPLPLKPRSEHKLIGTSQKQKEARAIVTGERLFGIDQTMPGMLHAVMLRAPVLDASIAKVDDSAARAVPGVRHVIRLPAIAPDSGFRNRPLAEGVAVVADSRWAALKGREALIVEWAGGATAENSDERIAAAWADLVAGKGHRVSQTGDVDAAFSAAAKVVEARYDAPMVAHAPMEPQNTLAHVTAEGATVITPTQQPVGVAGTVADVLGIPIEKVKVVTVRCGGGFGRRLYTDMVAEAALIAKAVGVPVKLVWTRECDMATDLYRPGGAHRFRAAIDAGGTLTGWDHGIASQSRRYRSAPDQGIASLATSEVAIHDHPGALVPNRRYDYVPIDSAAPRGAWRAPGHNINGWTMQAFLDEVAEAAGQDPLAFRLAMLGEARDLPYETHGGPIFSTGRMAAVLRLAAAKGDWGKPLPKGSGRGIAGHFSFGSYVAHVVQVTMKPGGAFSVDRVTSGIDCGIVVNPNGVAMQNEGAINDALSTALGQAITIRGGQVEQSNFADYPMMRIDRAATLVETHIVPSDAPPRGMGEPSLPPFTAALTNAIHAASGKRIRSLPIGEQLA